MKTWKTTQNPEAALDLAEGRLIANMGIRIEVSFSTAEVLGAAKLLNQFTKESGHEGTATSQADVMAMASQAGLLPEKAELTAA